MTSCYKNRIMITFLARTCNVIDRDHASKECFFIEIMIILKAIKSHFEMSHNRKSFTLLAFHIKFTKLAKAPFLNLHMK